MLAWAFALGILGLSVPVSCSSKFYYSKNGFQTSDSCSICFEKDCLSLEQARCDYYAGADSVLNNDANDPGGVEDTAMRKEVDDLMFDLVDKVSRVSTNKECIPYVSRYTNCNKENVCLGCVSCTCDPDGKWNCTTTQLCRRYIAPMNIDHRVLVMVMDSLIKITANRPKKIKRSVTDNPEDFTVASTITLEQLSEWFYGVKPPRKKKTIPTKIKTTTTELTVIVQDKDITTEKTTVNIDPLLKVSKQATTDADYIAFDEVLRNIAVDSKSYNRRKPLENKDNNQPFDIDYMIMDDDNITSDTGTSNDNFADMVDLVEGDDVKTEATVDNNTKIVIDLLKAAGQPSGHFNVTEDYVANGKYEDFNTLENTNDMIEFSALNIMKREVSQKGNITVPNVVPTVTFIVNTTNTTNANTTNETIDLKENVLIPLNRIIIDKVKELENLKRIKENLLKYLKINGDQLENINKENNTNNKQFSIYSLAMETDLDANLRRSNPNMYDRYMFKLKTDILEVIRDIIGIQKYKKSEVPEDLKYLMHAMKRYVYNNKIMEKPKEVKLKRMRNFRRQMQQNSGRCDVKSFKDCLVQIFEVIDKDMPKSNALTPLSPASRKIMTHVIKSYYVDEFALLGLRIHDPNYNLTIDLKNIGNQWQGMAANLLSGTPFVSLYRMKLLHYVLTLDISKINDALSLIDFAHSRRMLPTLDSVSNIILEKINTGLTAIHNKMQIIMRYYSQKPSQQEPIQMRADTETTTTPQEELEIRKKKNRSFIKHIRTLLKSSKRDIAELLHRKVPKSEIVKQLAKKRLDEISKKRYDEYEETMKRWQINLELAQRTKRSVLGTLKTRIKNIIPNYLRYKVNPRIKKNMKNATRKADIKKKKRKAAKRERKNRKTTHKPKTSSLPVTTKLATTTMQVVSNKTPIN